MVDNNSCSYEWQERNYRWMWKVDTMQKIKVCMWQMCHNALPARGVLLKRGCNIDPRCLLCANDIETMDHLFIECPITGKVWELAYKHQWIPSNVLSNINHSWLHSFGMLSKVRKPKIL